MISTSRVALGVASRIVQNLEGVQLFPTFLSFPLAASSTDLFLARDLGLGTSIDFPLDRDLGLARSSSETGLAVARPAVLWYRFSWSTCFLAGLGDSRDSVLWALRRPRVVWGC